MAPSRYLLKYNTLLKKSGPEEEETIFFHGNYWTNIEFMSLLQDNKSWYCGVYL